MRSHPLYKITPLGGISKSSPRATDAVQKNKAYLARYELDRRSIFVGNLPGSFKESDLYQLFAEFGQIGQIDMHQVPSKYIGIYGHLSF